MVLFGPRSTKGVTRLSSSERAKIEIPDEIKEILIGILHDTHIRGIVVRKLVFFSYYYFIYFLTFYKVYINFPNLKVVYSKPKLQF